jgi:putative spermidine/putrescine transport system permease protein
VLLAPGLVALAGMLAALGFLFQFAFRAFIPGSILVGGWTLENIARVLRPLYLGYLLYLLDTVLLSLYTTALTLLLSYPVAYALARARARAVRSALLVLTLLPFFTGAVVRAYSWILMLGNEGFLNGLLLRLGIIATPYQLLFTQKGVVIGLVHFSMPVMILILAAALSHVDPTYERSAQSLGAGPVRTFWTVTLPLSMPGVISGGLVIFAWTFSAFPTPALIGGGRVKMIANVVEDLALEAFNWPGGAAFAMVSLAATFVLLYLIQRAVPGVGGGAHRFDQSLAPSGGEGGSEGSQGEG